MILVANKSFCGLPAGEYPIEDYNSICYDNNGNIDWIYINFINDDNKVDGLQAEVVNPYSSDFTSSDDYEKNGDEFLWSEDFVLKDKIIPFEEWPKIRRRK